MSVKQIVPGVYGVSLGMVNVFLLDAGELVLIDAGIAGAAGRILAAVREIGRRPQDLKHILVTHHHVDHVGSLAALQQASGAQVSMHALDAAAYQGGTAIRRMQSSGGLLSRLVVAAINRSAERSRPAAAPAALARIDNCLAGGETLPLAGGIQALHTPGHTAGHLAFLWPQQGGVLFAGDAAARWLRLGFSPLYEDFEQGRRALRALSSHRFETACFSHGAPLRPAADARFRRLWSPPAYSA
jgi:glyoxylase-like metal-dependent hydrolase (beta-lactamase superfamily II)